MSTHDDVECRLDAEHIRSVCQGHSERTVNVTQVDEPPHVYVETELRTIAYEDLRQVGYLTELSKDGNGLVVTGWSTTRLAARAAALAGLLDRWHHTLADTAARAVDIYALLGIRGLTESDCRTAVRRAEIVLRHEADWVTGHHAAQDPNTRPSDSVQARLVDENQRLETAIADHIRDAERVATYAVAAYAEDPNVPNDPASARARAITSAMGRHSADIRSEHAERRAAADAISSTPISSTPGRDHPAAVAATDQPADPAPPVFTTAVDPAGAKPPPPPRGRTP